MTTYEDEPGSIDTRTNTTFTFIPGDMDAVKDKEEIQVECRGAILHIEGVIHRTFRVRNHLLENKDRIHDYNLCCRL